VAPAVGAPPSPTPRLPLIAIDTGTPRAKVLPIEHDGQVRNVEVVVVCTVDAAERALLGESTDLCETVFEERVVAVGFIPFDQVVLL
jgi:hypothetical protein